MISFTTRIEKYGANGEKSGWTYIVVTADLACQLQSKHRKAFSVDATLDGHVFGGMNLVPVGSGNYILPLNAAIRKKTGKATGQLIEVILKLNMDVPQLSADLLCCLEDAPEARAYFFSLPPSHRKYYSNWIESAKTEPTKTRRIAQAIEACRLKQHYGEMIKSLKSNR